MPENTEGSYEIVPFKEFVELKRQLEELKKKNNEEPSSKELVKSMNDLTASIGSMIQLFKSATDELKLEEREGETLSKKIGPLMEKVDKVIWQNKTLAEGLVSIVDIVNEMKAKVIPEHPPIHPSFERQVRQEHSTSHEEPLDSGPTGPNTLGAPLRFERFEPNQQQADDFGRRQSPRFVPPPPMMPPPGMNQGMHNQMSMPPPRQQNMPSPGGQQQMSFPPPFQGGEMPDMDSSMGMPPPNPYDMPAGPIPSIDSMPPFGPPQSEQPKKKGPFSFFKKK